MIKPHDVVLDLGPVNWENRKWEDMLELVDKVLVAVESEDSDIQQLLDNLDALKLITKVISWKEITENNTEPTIICAKLFDIENKRLTLDNNDHGYVLWHKDEPNKGRFITTDDSTEHQKTLTISFNDSVCILIQSHMQRYPSYAENSPMYWQNNMIGDSREFTQMLELAKKIAQIDCDVLIQGETGTGKELVARSIHYQSERADYPFVPINCGAFSDELLLSELFGHTKGAFTGADSDRIGLIEQAENGTLFLDEIDSLSSKAQVALLRYLQDREIRPQGSNTLRSCNTRVVAASNKSLQDLVSRNKFREDLLFRLDVLHIDLPPLRQRGNDIHLLIQYFMNQAASEYHHQRKVFSSNMLLTMSEYEWPGNIRQLQNIVYRLFLLSDQFVIRTEFAAKLAGINWKDYLPSTDKNKLMTSMQKEKQRVIELFESTYLKNVLTETSGNVSQAAKIAKKERRSFIRLMKKYSIKRKDFITT